MENNQVQICRLCFEICKSSYQSMKGTTRDILNSFLPNVDLGISCEPLICTDCVDNLKKISDFKTCCLHRKDHLFIRPRDVILSESRKCLGENVVAASTDSVCCFCLEGINRGSAVFLFVKENNLIVLLEKYFPELVQNLSMDSTVCTVCHQSLQNQLAFLNACLAIEERIKQYCKVEGTDSKGQVELSNVLNFMTKNQLRNNMYNNLNTVKVEDFRGQTEIGNKVKVENADFIEIEEQLLHYDDSKDIKIETGQDGSDRYDASRTKQKNLKLPIRKSVSEAARFKCSMCPCQSNRKSDLARHMLTHKSLSELTMYKCDLCTFQSKHKRDLPIHNLTHRSISEVTVYKCELCAFQTKYKKSLQRHSLTHRSISEVTTYKCEVCPFETKYKTSLHLHTLTHKDISEVAAFKCETCGFQSKHKRSIQLHILLTHKETSTYKCEMCTFQTKYARYLQRHMLTHNCTTEERVYTCDTCGYRTQKKANLEKHILVHKSASEVTLYRCEVCAFRSKHKNSLRLHMSTHRNPSKDATYKCEMCAYQGKCKRNLTNHMLSHKNPAEVPVYKCELCTYQTKRKRDLSQHMITHKIS